jgi:hypothetical protein
MSELKAGKSWCSIIKVIPGRTDVQCRARHVKVMQTENVCSTSACKRKHPGLSD